jgi:hypothetical protein
LLARLAASPERDRFILKGTFLFTLWADRPHRATRDLDLLGRGDPSAEELIATFATIVRTEVEPDGLSFDAAGITASPIREAAHDEGVRLMLPAALGKTRFRLQVEIGFGDAVLPRPRLVSFPTVLDHEPPRIKAYPREAVVAEMLQALVALGIVNSRMKDVHDRGSWRMAMDLKARRSPRHWPRPSGGETHRSLRSHQWRSPRRSPRSRASARSGPRSWVARALLLDRCNGEPSVGRAQIRAVTPPAARWLSRNTDSPWNASP